MKLSNFENNLEQTWYVDFLGYDVSVIIQLGSGEKIDDFAELFQNVISWDEQFFKKLEPMLFDYYTDTLIMCGEEEPVIQTAKDVWRFLRIGALTLFSNEGKYFILGSGSCDWEEEHGLEFDVNIANQIVYVGQFVSNGFHEDPDNPSMCNYIKSNA